MESPEYNEDLKYKARPERREGNAQISEQKRDNKLKITPVTGRNEVILCTEIKNSTMRKKNYVKILSSLIGGAAMLFTVNANAQWAAMGAGAGSGSVSSLAGFNGDVYIGGGYFTPYQNLSVWNGSTYSAPLASPGSNAVPALTSYDSVLYLAEGYNVYQQVGSSVSKIGTMNSSISALYFWNHKLYVGGNFTTINSKTYNYIASYDGSKWDSLVSGGANGMTSDVYAFCTYNGQLAVGGYFWTGGTTLLDCVGLWDGAGNWTKLGNGMFDPSGGYEVLALASWNGNLYAGGYLDSASGVKVTGLAQWNGTAWDSVGPRKYISSTVYALTTFNGQLVAGGYFDSVMSWNGSIWTALGGPLAKNSEVEAMITYNNILYIGGQLSTIGSLSVSNVAQYTAPLGINEISNNNSLTVYPNPSDGKFTIEEQGVRNKEQVEVYNMLGERVYAAPLPQTPKGALNTIDLSNQPSGIYLYRVMAEDGSLIGNGKLVINK